MAKAMPLADARCVIKHNLARLLDNMHAAVAEMEAAVADIADPTGAV